QWVHRHGRGLDLITPLIRQILEGVGAIHRLDMVHHDLKPGNVMVNQHLLRIVDFGLAWAPQAGRQLDETGVIVGTPEYMAPEQFLEAAPDLRADVYALGVMIYELLTGRYPFAQGDLKFLIQQRLHGLPVPIQNYRTDLPDRYADLVMRMLARDPDERPSSCEQVLAEWTGERQTANGSQRLFEPRFVGRLGELDRVYALIARAAADDTTVTFVTGEAGSGKSCFLSHVARSAGFYGAAVARGGWEAGNPRPLSGLLEALQSLGELELPSADHRTALFAAVQETLSTALANKPLLIILEDLHFSGGFGIELVVWLMRNRALFRKLALLISLRDEALERGSSLRRLLDVFVDHDRIQLLTLPPLEPDRMTDMVSSMLGTRQVDAALMDRLAETTGGNPLHIWEEVHELTAAGVLERVGGQWEYHPAQHEKSSLPEKLARRFNHFSPEEMRVLQQAAVLGPDFSLELLHRTLPDERVGLEVVEHALHLRILIRRPVREGREMLAFYHARLRDAVLADINPARLADYHRTAAVALNACDPDDVFYLAYHWSGAGDAKRASAYLLQAALKARRHGDLHRSAECLHQALSLVPSAEQDRIREDLVNVLLMLGHTIEARTHLNHLLEDGHLDPVRRMRAWRKLGRAFLYEGRSGDAVRAFNEGITLCEKPPSALSSMEVRAAFGAAHVHHFLHLHTGDESRREQITELFLLYNGLTHALFEHSEPGTPQLAELAALRQRNLAESLQDSLSLARSAATFVLSGLRHESAMGKLLPVLRQALDLVPTLARGPAKAHILITLAQAAMQTSLHADAGPLAHTAVELAEAFGDVVDHVDASVVLADCEMWYGDLSWAHTLLNGVWGLAEHAGFHQVVRGINARLALVNALSGETEAAVRWTGALAMVVATPTGLHPWHVLSRAWLRLQRQDAAGAATELHDLLELMHPGTTPVFLHAIATALWALARLELVGQAPPGGVRPHRDGGGDLYDGVARLLEGLSEAEHGHAPRAAAALQRARQHFEAAGTKLLAAWTWVRQAQLQNQASDLTAAARLLEGCGAYSAAVSLLT
ncbi:MAG: protein kinase domain-containing protein, partial [Candidatus Xenobia bacterium]